MLIIAKYIVDTVSESYRIIDTVSGGEVLKVSRREEIINACSELYGVKGFREITLKDIAEVLPFGRSTIYNYFQTKEEIFLALLQREYELWTQELDEVIAANEALTREEIAGVLARSLENRKRLLKLMSMNHFDMEEGSRLENLTEFKAAYGASMKAVARCLAKFCPDMGDKERQEFVYSFFPFVYGLYPYAVVTDKQREAMNTAGVNYVYMSVYELAFTCAKKLLEVN